MRAMIRDPFLAEWFRTRPRLWSIEPDDPTDPEQVQVAERITLLFQEKLNECYGTPWDQYVPDQITGGRKYPQVAHGVPVDPP